ncbi:hypothetical protein ACFV2X_41490 [Streptomyces sp. NPDC059679]|uniref:hypothetical protein n=1 Tax=Streptomyces sp. NPDC059679 TaxID=3346903 RepID=UPI0036775593
MHTKMRLVGAAVAGAVLLPVGASSTAFGQSAPAGATGAAAARGCVSKLPDSAKAQTDRVTALIQKLEGQGLSQERIDAKLAADYCLERVDGGGSDLSTLGSPSDEIKLSKPVIYKTSGKDRYIAAAGWKWKRFPGNVNGYDAFGITFSKKVTPLAHSLVYQGNGNLYGKKKVTQAQESGPYGSGFLFNEGPRNIYRGDMQGYQGLMGISFKASKVGCWNLQAFSKYGHSWKSTRATGFSIGKWSIGVTWTNYNHNWQQASQPSKEVTVCRKF